MQSSTISICGGGIGGLAAALALKQAGFNPTIFERHAPERIREEGLFLTLAPNGINALCAIGLADRVVAAGLPTLGLAVFNEHGRQLALVDYSGHAARYGAASATMRRGALAGILLDAVVAAGIPIVHGANVTGVTQDRDGVTLVVDGRGHRFALALACDGLRSSVRRLVFPHYPQPRYSGLIGNGGFVDAPNVAPTAGVMNMVFGRRGFFGYIKSAGQPVYWFNSYPADESDIGPIDNAAEHARQLGTLHAGDPLDVGAVLAATKGVEQHYPIYDMPELPTWSDGRVVLMGDAAHAVAPHSGQGASLAIEDGVVLAACLADASDHTAAFTRFETLRRARVHKAIALGRAVGSQKQAQSWLELRIRDLILPIFMPMGARMQEKLFAFRADQTPLALPVQ